MTELVKRLTELDEDGVWRNPEGDEAAALITALETHCTNLEKALGEAEFWLDGALNCKEWRWDADQHEAATSSLATIRAAIASAPKH